uniref:40S ribosomal protein S27 n=1 Tax=Oryza glumipatula TaxID=40148 RepID=A0A0D9ZJ72_9ORYZ
MQRSSNGRSRSTASTYKIHRLLSRATPSSSSPSPPSPRAATTSLCAAAAAAVSNFKMVLSNDIDLLNPPAELEKLKHKKKRLVQSPNSFFMDVKCQGCFNITTVFSHSQTVVVCPGCQTVLCQPTGGKARLTEGCSFRRKGD